MCQTTVLTMAFDYHEDEKTEVNWHSMREKMSTDFPQQYLGESADRTQPGK